MPADAQPPPTDMPFETVIPAVPLRTDSLVQALAGRVRGPFVTAPRDLLMESAVSVIASLVEAPTRTPRETGTVRSSPLALSSRDIIETRAFGRSFEALQIALDDIDIALPGLECPPEGPTFLASDRSFEELSLSVDALLQHRKRLLLAESTRTAPRRRVLVLGAGPGGLMTAIELRLRDHDVVVCETRQRYTRNRFIGMYKESAFALASLGIPERMTYDFSNYRGKRGMMLADIQTFLHAVALKLGVVIYTGAIVRDLATVHAGTVELKRCRTAGERDLPSVGVTRWYHDTVTRVASGVVIRFDTIVEATGGRSGLRELLVGADQVVSLKTLGQAAQALDPSLRSYFDTEADNSAELVLSLYPGDRHLQDFSAALAEGDSARVPDELPCFVSNIDASILRAPIEASGPAAGKGARIGDIALRIPKDWVVVRCPLPDQRLTRYQIEGPLPQTFEYGDGRVRTADVLGALNPLGLLMRILYAMGVPFDMVDRRRLIDFYSAESSTGDATDIVATWVGRFKSLRIGGDRPVIWGTVPGCGVRYGIVGEAIQNAWYRVGVGLDDTLIACRRFARALDLDEAQATELAALHEREMLCRAVQVLYHLFSVAQNTDQGVVGPVLTELYLDDHHRANLAETRLNDEVRHGTETLTALTAVAGRFPDRLLERAIEVRLDHSCRRVLDLLSSLPYDAGVIDQARVCLQGEHSDRRRHAAALLAGVLAPAHRELVEGLFAPPPGARRVSEIAAHEHVLQLAGGGHPWVTPWVRACALLALDPVDPENHDDIAHAAQDADPLVRETALLLSERAKGTSSSGGSIPIVDRVSALSEVALFKDIPHEELATYARLLTERTVPSGARIIEEGELGDCLYLVVSGRVRVHQGDKTLNELGCHDHFGVLSLLDSGPRAASATALEPTVLLRLAKSDFYAIIAQRVEILQAISRVLCDHIRAAL